MVGPCQSLIVSSILCTPANESVNWPRQTPRRRRIGWRKSPLTSTFNASFKCIVNTVGAVYKVIYAHDCDVMLSLQAVTSQLTPFTFPLSGGVSGGVPAFGRDCGNSDKVHTTGAPLSCATRCSPQHALSHHQPDAALPGLRRLPSRERPAAQGRAAGCYKPASLSSPRCCTGQSPR